MISGGGERTYGRTSPFVFRNNDTRLPSNVSVEAKTHYLGRHFLMWAGRRYLLKILISKIDEKMTFAEIEALINEFFLDTAVQKALSIILIEGGPRSNVAIRSWECSTFEDSDNPNFKGVCAGSGEGDLFYNEYVEEREAKSWSAQKAIGTLIETVLREQLDPDFYQKSYGFGLRIHRLTNGKMRPLNYKLDFVYQDNVINKAGPIGGFRYFAFGNQEWFCKIDARKLGDKALTYDFVDVAAGRKKSSIGGIAKLIEKQFTAKYEVSLLFVTGSDGGGVFQRVKPRLIRYRFLEGKHPVCILPESHDIVDSMVSRLKRRKSEHKIGDC